jgi:hypothetical protein
MSAAPTVSEFERVAREFNLRPEEYVHSIRLREWANQNRRSKYVPESLLEAWGFEIEAAV